MNVSIKKSPNDLRPVSEPNRRRLRRLLKKMLEKGFPDDGDKVSRTDFTPYRRVIE